MSSILNRYIEKYKVSHPLILQKPSPNLQMIVIIPAYNEPDIFATLNSLKKCKKPENNVEVIILINHTANTPLHIKEINREVFNKIITDYSNSDTGKLQFCSILIEDMPQKHAGAGLARKTAMDEAIRRFAYINNDNGIIISLDADTFVSENYLINIEKAFFNNSKLNCAILNFKHLITANTLPKEKNAIILYELYLHYFKQAMKYTGFPYAYHTIGSCFAVKASVYAKQGGMNKRQGGEDFYFLHKIFPLGNTMELNSVTVYPSARVSDRVPFGTGPAVKEIIEQGDFLTYRFEYFTYLKNFFNTIESLYNANNDAIYAFYESLDISLKEFISDEEFLRKITEINNNSASLAKFKQRFYYWFDAFKVIKYLNFVHSKTERVSVVDAVKYYFTDIGIKEQPKTTEELLAALRNIT